MAVFVPLPLGRRIPDLPHAVSVSIPTLKDLRGYEEKDPETLRQMPTGYPRFVVHPFVKMLAGELADRLGLAGRRLWPTVSEKTAHRLLEWLSDASARLFEFQGVYGVSHDETPELSARAKAFLQHTGGLLSSRRAEDELVRLGLLDSIERERCCTDNAGDRLWEALSPWLTGSSKTDAFFTSSGINAVYSAFRAVTEVQAPRGRSVWIQLGWVYLDTIAILKKFTHSAADHRIIRRVDDRAELERLLAEEGDRVAGIIAEVPNNPMIQAPDMAWLSGLARSHGVHLILDPSVASFYAVDLLPWADVLVSSLTKYTAHEGDVIAGLAVVNPSRPDAQALRSALAEIHEPLYSRDLARLAAQAPEAPRVFALIEERLRAVAGYLQSHPGVRRVYWSRASEYEAAFQGVSRTSQSVGGMLSFELKVPFAPFFDALRLPKGPSFGITTSLVCPFIWLAHYDLVTTPEGQAELAAAGIPPDLVRLAVGTEPLCDMIAALDEAFKAAGV